MKRYFIATEIDITNNCEHVQYHEFEASDYRSLTSLNAFFYGTKGYNVSKTRLFNGSRKFEWLEEKLREENPDRKPTIVHETIWDFYKYIGYDYKHKKYV